MAALTFGVLAGVRREDLEARTVAVPGAEVLGVLSCHTCRGSVGTSEHNGHGHLGEGGRGLTNF